MACPLSAMAVTYYVVLPKWYSESHGLSVSDLGIWLLLSRAWDAVSDPLCGIVSDRFAAIGIGRKSIVRVGVFLLVFSFYFLLNPNSFVILNPAWVFIVFSFIFYTGFTLVSVPYEAMAVEIEPRSENRTGLIGFRDAFLLLGTILAAVMPILLGGNGENESLFKLSTAYILIFIFAYLIFECVRPASRSSSGSMSAEKISHFFSNLKYNEGFLRLLLAFIIQSLGAALPAALFLFFSKYIIGASEKEAYFALFVYFAAGFLFLPLWLSLTNRFQKKYLWFMAQIINAGAFIPVVFLGHGDYHVFLGLVALSAVGFGGSVVMPSLLQADVLEASWRNSGKKREGGLVGLWSVARKMSQAIGSGLGLLVLGLSGFSPEGFNANNGAPQLEPVVRYTMAVLYCVVPSILVFFSIFIAWPLRIESSLKELKK
ncbi:MAG TPA: MFS transporter [Oligoflexia bacterium]|nr:MFS transporter [Oligoflexia bacterium]HMP48474.1 MFS transporter [Oligoflexia bacterium]